jgi:hypothetical protein
VATEPAVHIAIRAGDPRPSVFVTALSPAENLRLSAWLSENPKLDELWRTAWALADEEEEHR